MGKLAEYRKAAVAVVGFAAVVVLQMFAPDSWPWQLANAVLAGFTAFGVYKVPNQPAG